MCTPKMPMDKDGVRAVIKAMNARSHDLYQELSQYRADHLPLDETVVQELDPDKSIKWNREEAKRRNRSRSSTIGAYKAKINQCDAAVAQAMMDYIRDEYGFEGPVAERIYEHFVTNCKTNCEDYCKGLTNMLDCNQLVITP